MSILVDEEVASVLLAPFFPFERERLKFVARAKMGHIPFAKIGGLPLLSSSIDSMHLMT